MCTLGFISKENPVYLYRIVRSDKEHASNVSFKEFIVVKAWSSKSNDVLLEGHRYFDYYYNGRLYKKQEVGLSEFSPFMTFRSFNVWSYERYDDYAIRECQKWIDHILSNHKNDIHYRALKLMADKAFNNTLSVIEKDGIIK